MWRAQGFAFTPIIEIYNTLFEEKKVCDSRIIGHNQIKGCLMSN